MKKIKITLEKKSQFYIQQKLDIQIFKFDNQIKFKRIIVKTH